MRYLLKLEAVAEFALGLYLFSQLSYSWGWFALLFLTPDVGMLGYLINAKIGAWTYNFCHHKALAIILFLSGIFFSSELIQGIGVIIFAHIAFDRVLGYGLKYERGFTFTHLQ